MFSVDPEGEAEEVGLRGAAAEAIVGKVAKFVGLEIQNREGLLSFRGVGAVAAVEQNRKTAVRRNGRSRRKIVDLSRMARQFSKNLSVGDLRLRARSVFLSVQNADSGSNQQNDEEGPRKT